MDVYGAFFPNDKTLRHPVLRQERGLLLRLEVFAHQQDIPGRSFLGVEEDLLELCPVSHLPTPVLQFIIDKVFGVELLRQSSDITTYPSTLTLLCCFSPAPNTAFPNTSLSLSFSTSLYLFLPTPLSASTLS